MNLVTPTGSSFRIPVDLMYAADDPLAVRLTFRPRGKTPVSWSFARELLIAGMSGPAGDGDVRIRPVHEELSEVSIALNSPGGSALLLTSGIPLATFLVRTSSLVPIGREITDQRIDAELSAILDGR
ncbi:SsgA family sporulation/cell division regulator [Kitasatospora sp. NPDC018619]|uniref:SsgA family sporulation/cell division regulator n=1 Tax=unclassified Kitasatospora TaxID=2633591 RepID=UPI0037A088FC